MIRWQTGKEIHLDIEHSKNYEHTVALVKTCFVSESDLRAPYLLEALAALEHEQWMAWSKSIAEKVTLTPEHLARWKYLWRPYDKLPEEEKKRDRIWAEKVLRELWGDENK